MQDKVENKAENANSSEHHKTQEVRTLLSHGAIGGLVSAGGAEQAASKEQSAGNLKEHFGTLTIEDRSLNNERKDSLNKERMESIEPQIWESSPGLSKELEKLGRAAEKLIDLSLEKLPAKDAEALFKSMTLFERSARWRGVDSEQVAGTYDQVARLLDTTNVPGMAKERERQALATQILAKANDPTAIDQGAHRTCNVTVVESRIYQRKPAEAARLVTDVALTGEYRSRSGLQVTLDRDSLTPQREEVDLVKADGKRDFAGQLFQVTAINLSYANFNPRLRYVQTAPEDHSKTASTGGISDNGERLLDISAGDVRNGGEMVEYGRPNMLQRMFGAGSAGERRPSLMNDQVVFIANEISGEAAGKNDREWFLDYSKVKSSEDLKNKIRTAKKDGQLPLVAMVATDNEPFFTDGGGDGDGAGSGKNLVGRGWHLVNITDIDDDEPGRVAIDNQWGKNADRIAYGRRVTVDTLYFAMREPKDKEVAREMQKAAETKPDDETFQLAALRRLNISGEIRDKPYMDRFAKTIAGFDRRYMSGQLRDEDEAMRTRFVEMNSMPLATRIQLVEQMHSAGRLDKGEFDRLNKLYESMKGK